MMACYGHVYWLVLAYPSISFHMVAYVSILFSVVSFNVNKYVCVYIYIYMYICVYLKAGASAAEPSSPLACNTENIVKHKNNELT